MKHFVPLANDNIKSFAGSKGFAGSGLRGVSGFAGSDRVCHREAAESVTAKPP